jgi:hypothetical protein
MLLALAFWAAATVPCVAQVSIGAFGLVNKVGVSGDAPINGSWSSALQFGGGLVADLRLNGDISLTAEAQWERRTTALQYTIPHPTEPRKDTTVDSFYINTDYVSVPIGMRVYN